MAKTPRIYFDYNAGAPILECAKSAMVKALNDVGNASSVHFEGRDARKKIEQSRKSLAQLIKCDPANIVFTSGATEAANHALSPIIRGGGQEMRVSKLYISETEHPCVLEGGRFAVADIIQIPVLPSGQIDLIALEEMLNAHDASSGIPMVAVQYANNETGVIQSLKEIAELIHNIDGFLVVDAVQALGKIEFSLEETDADFLILSSHKIGGPQGAGALVLRNAALSPLPLSKGGGQESYHRGGTENVAAISGFGAACEWHAERFSENTRKKVSISDVRDSIEEQLVTISQQRGNKIGPPIFFGKTTDRLENTSCFAVPGIKAETALMALDLDGVSLSSGSACSSGKVKGSHVLKAMGAKEEELEGALRLSLGWETQEADAERFLKAWDKLATRLAA